MKESAKKETQIGKYTYHWYKHHMAWTIHTPANCCLGKQHKDNQKKTSHKASSATIPDTAITATSAQYVGSC
jgi:hypothetical protein